MSKSHVGKKILVIGQAPPEHIQEIPFGKTRLFKWLGEVGLDQQEALITIEFAALIGHFPGKGKKGHLAPSQTEICRYRPELIKILQKTDPKVIVPVGLLAIREVLNNKDALMTNSVGRSFSIAPLGLSGKKLKIVPLPHPSGASAWVYMGENSILLKNALSELRNAINLDQPCS